MKNEKLKRYQVTQTLRFPSNIMKGFFYAGLVLLPLGLVVAVLRHCRHRRRAFGDLAVCREVHFRD